jgi:hypothetical protein
MQSFGSPPTLTITRWEKHCKAKLRLDNAFALIEGHPGLRNFTQPANILPPHITPPK